MTQHYLSDEEILRAVRPLYADDKAAQMGAKDDIRTARAAIAAYAAQQAAHPATGGAEAVNAERALFGQTIDDFCDAGETSTPYETLLDWANRGLLEAEHFVCTAAGRAFLDGEAPQRRPVEQGVTTDTLLGWLQRLDAEADAGWSPDALISLRHALAIARVEALASPAVKEAPAVVPAGDAVIRRAVAALNAAAFAHPSAADDVGTQCFNAARELERLIAAAPDLPAVKEASQGEAVAPDIEKLTQLIADRLSGTYHCLRVWSAWGVGTMSQDDFEDVGESDTPAELAAEIVALLATPPTPAPAPAGGSEAVIWQARIALKTGVREINNLGGARQAMPLHYAIEAIDEYIAATPSMPAPATGGSAS